MTAQQFQKSILASLTEVTDHGSYTEGKPSSQFWELWAEGKGVIKAAGFSVSKDGYDWCVCVSQDDLTEPPYDTLEELVDADRQSRKESAFWSSQKNWHILTNAKS